jgi:hypothetical protein
METLRVALHYRDTLNYPAIVALCDAASVESLFQQYRENVRPLTRDDLHARHPHLSDTQIALLERAEPRAQVERDKQIALRLPGTSGYGELKLLSADEFLRRYLGGGDVRHELVRRLTLANRPVPAWLVEPSQGVRYEITSAQATDATTVRICYLEVADSYGGMAVADTAREELRLDRSGRWRLVAHYELLERRGARGSIIPEEYGDLFSAEPGG